MGNDQLTLLHIWCCDGRNWNACNFSLHTNSISISDCRFSSFSYF